MNNNKKHIQSILVSFWSVQNSILQSLRTIFIATNTILLSIVTFIASQEEVSLAFVLMLSVLGWVLCSLWIKTCGDRGSYDTYFRWQIFKLETGKEVPENVLQRFLEWRKKGKSQKQAEYEDKEFKRLIFSSTRIILDKCLPITVSILFGLVLLFSVIMRSPIFDAGLPLTKLERSIVFLVSSFVIVTLGSFLFLVKTKGHE